MRGSAIKINIGDKFNNLTVIERNGHSSFSIAWRCRCDCGKERTVTSTRLKDGIVTSCGCNKEKIIKSLTTHGLSKTRIYHCWQTMKNRCTRESNRFYKNYGGRGIKVCDRWLESFENFYEDMASTYMDHLELDRIDVNKNYEPNNCRWITHKQQQRNKRTNHLFTNNGITKTIIEWAEETGLNPNTIIYRIRRNCPTEKVLNKPVRS